MSKYGGSEPLYITPAQFIAEKLCELNAKDDLPIKFWELPEWNKAFRRYINDANKFLKKYTAGVILAAMKDKRLYYMKSLYFPPFEKIAKEYMSKLAREENTPTIINEPAEQVVPPTVFSPTKSGGLSKLRSLEQNA